MQIQWLGHSCVKLQGQQTESTVVIDPYGMTVGKLGKQGADMVISSTDDEAYRNLEVIKPASEKKLFVIQNPGEYEANGVFVYGIDIWQDKSGEGTDHTMVASLNFDDLFIGHLGALNRPLTESELDTLGRIDVLIVPVGGHGVLSAKTALEVINQLEPRVIIPIHYAIDGDSTELDTLDVFLKAYGIAMPEAVDKYKISKKDLPADEMKMVILTPQ